MSSDQCTHVDHGENGHCSLTLVEAEDKVLPNTLVIDLEVVAVVIDCWLEVRDGVDVDMERVDGGDNEEALVILE